MRNESERASTGKTRIIALFRSSIQVSPFPEELHTKWNTIISFHIDIAFPLVPFYPFMLQTRFLPSSAEWGRTPTGIYHVRGLNLPVLTKADINSAKDDEVTRRRAFYTCFDSDGGDRRREEGVGKVLSEINHRLHAIQPLLERVKGPLKSSAKWQASPAAFGKLGIRKQFQVAWKKRRAFLTRRVLV